MNECNKAILIGISLTCVTMFGSLWIYLVYRPASDSTFIRDKFTHCLQIAMSEARQSGKVIDVDKAAAICVNVNKGNIS